MSLIEYRDSACPPCLFFENLEEGIILEDDCLPSQSFFWFCQELLKYYQDDTRVMMISGTNYGYVDDDFLYDYFFSKNIAIWGWSTWKRAWRFYDINMKSFNKFRKENQIKNVFKTKQEQNYWIRTFQIAYDSKIDTWDYQWLYSRLIGWGISIHLKVNLVQNIVFKIDASHTKNGNKKIRNNLSKNLRFPLNILFLNFLIRSPMTIYLKM